MSTTTHILRWQQSQIVDDGYSILDKLADHRNWSADAEIYGAYTVSLIRVGVDKNGEPTEDDVDTDGFDDRDTDPEEAEPYEAAEDRLLAKHSIDRANVTVEVPW